jgi:radical SAM superfamily enzyme YgiQ (UPF0313 family)
MKILVTNPPWPGPGYGTRSNVRWPHRRGDKVLTFPVYLAYTLSALKKKGFDATGIDAVDQEWGIFEFVEQIRKKKPDIIIMEVSTPSIMIDLETAHLLKTETHAQIVFCGPHATYFHQDILENYLFVDICIRGEFDLAASDLCDALSKQKPLHEVTGITFRENNKVIVNPDRPFFPTPDELPFPDREDFRIERYQQAFFGGKKTALVITSRGCPYGCTYCLWPKTITGNKFRARSPKNIVDELELLITKYQVDEIYFDDETFTVNKNRVIAICDELLKRKVKLSWMCMGRVDNVDEEVLSHMKKAGCRQVFYGLESGSEAFLKEMKKGITKEQMIRAIRMTQKAGLVAGGSFILGMPDENRDTIKETLRFAKKLGANYVQFAVAVPFPGTELYEQVKSLGLLRIKSWSDFDQTQGPVIRTKHLSSHDLKGLLNWAYKSYYTSPRVIWNNLISIRSMNDLRKILRGMKSILARLIYYKK